MSHARILPYPLRAAAPRRYLRFVRLIWRLGNVYLRFVRLSEHDTLGITVLRLLESCGSRSASTLPSTPRNADSPLFSPLSALIHLSVRDFQWAIGKGSSQTAPRTVFVLYDDNQLGRDIQGRGRFHSARLSCTNIHNPCPKVRKRSVLREHQRPRRAGEVEGLYDTTDVSNPWWKYPVTGDENETDLFGGASAAYNRGAMVQITVRPPLDAADDRVFDGLVRGRTAIRHHASGRAAVGAFVRRAGRAVIPRRMAAPGALAVGQRRPKPMIAGVTEAMCLLLVFIAVIIICPHLA